MEETLRGILRRREHVTAHRLVPADDLARAGHPARTSSRAVASQRIPGQDWRRCRRGCGTRIRRRDPACPISRTTRRCRKAGWRRSRAHVAASAAADVERPADHIHLRRSTSGPAGSRRAALIQPGGVRTLIPIPLSSHTSSSGRGKPLVGAVAGRVDRTGRRGVVRRGIAETEARISQPCGTGHRGPPRVLRLRGRYPVIRITTPCRLHGGCRATMLVSPPRHARLGPHVRRGRGSPRRFPVSRKVVGFR